MIWIQEFGQRTGANRADYKLFYCETQADKQYLPDLTSNGDWSHFDQRISTPSDTAPAKVGDQALFWGDGDLKTLMPDNRWKSVGE